jgi:hypothetical protein
MNFDLNSVVAICVFLAAQTGALLWWGGSMTEAVRTLQREARDAAEITNRLSNEVAFIRGERGIKQ